MNGQADVSQIFSPSVEPVNFTVIVLKLDCTDYRMLYVCLLCSNYYYCFCQLHLIHRAEVVGRRELGVNF
jgi:hypothetical protein